VHAKADAMKKLEIRETFGKTVAGLLPPAATGLLLETWFRDETRLGRIGEAVLGAVTLRHRSMRPFPAPAHASVAGSPKGAALRRVRHSSACPSCGHERCRSKPSCHGFSRYFRTWKQLLDSTDMLFGDPGVPSSLPSRSCITMCIEPGKSTMCN